MACGTPVVSTRVGGTPEIVAAPEAGVLAEERTAEGIALALRRLLGNYPDRKLTHGYAKGFDWATTARAQLQLFESVLLQQGGA
jgi:glycosyltransferase involved in cell wall biosynthesis